MPPRRVIGIDAGGTKLLGGVVDEELVVHHRVHRQWRGADRQETLDIVVEAVEEVRAAAPDVDAVGFGMPVAGGRRDGRLGVVEPPADRRRAVPRPDERAARPAGGGGQRRERRPPWPSTATARRAAPTTRVMVALGTGHRRRAGARRAALPRRARLRRRARPHGGRPRRRGLPGRLPGPRLPRGAGLGHGDRPRGRGGGRGGARSRRSGRRLARRAARSPAALVTELAHDGDEQARDGAGRDRASGSAPGSPGS